MKFIRPDPLGKVFLFDFFPLSKPKADSVVFPDLTKGHGERRGRGRRTTDEGGL